MDNLEKQLYELKSVSKKLANIPLEVKNEVLERIARKIESNKDSIIKANLTDLEAAKNNVSDAVYNRLTLSDSKIGGMINGLRDLIKLENPVNKKLFSKQLDDGLILHKISCPIGVLAVIFEARPDVITQVAGLAIKSSNALVLKGGKEVQNTNRTIFNLILDAIDEVEEFPNGAVIQIYSRDEVKNLLDMGEYIDLVIPRGGNSLVKYIKENTRIPVLGHADGVCHIYVDESANFEMTKRIVVDAKCQYPSACNSVETLLVHKDFLMRDELINVLKAQDIEIIFNPKSYRTEYSSKKLTVKFVGNLDEAISHINQYGSGHTDSILTDNISNAERFMNEVDSAGVYHNASTRFADGYRYGFGAEVGISTNKIHARGPVGLDGLTIYKYKLCGNGQVVGDYVEGVKTFNHVDLQ